MTFNQFKNISNNFAKTSKMPVLFVGHGNPMNAIEENKYTAAWIDLGASLPRPNAVLSISAHWLTEGSFVNEVNKPETLHDFWGFPEELYGIQYNCAGAPELAKQVRSLFRKTIVGSDTKWGLDHGTWVPLMRIFPNADIPTFQLSLDVLKTTESHYGIGAELASLRERGVLIISSGNIVHNLGRMNYDRDAKPFDWAVEFDELSKELIAKDDHKPLISYEKLGNAAIMSIPTPDHYWPLLYALALKQRDDEVSFPVNGIAHSSVSMRAVLIGL